MMRGHQKGPRVQRVTHMVAKVSSDSEDGVEYVAASLHSITAPSLHSITAPSLQHHCAITAPSLHHHCTITAPSPHHHCTITAPSLHLSRSKD